MKIAISICATKNYVYAMPEQLARIQANIRDLDSGVVILVGDNSKELLFIKNLYISLFPEGWEVILAADPTINDSDSKYINYKEEAQLLIAKMRDTAFTIARKKKVDYLWSLDSDVLPPHNALRCMKTMLDFDDGYYSVSTCPYPNHSMIGGRGSLQHQIGEDFTIDERKVPTELKERYNKVKKELEEIEKQSRSLIKEGKLDENSFEELNKRAKLAREDFVKVNEEIKKCPPDGNIWEVIAKYGWRKRGWLEFSYPAIGKGSVVPSDWAGFGCNLLDKRALETASFVGYEGKGTEDLYCIWNYWYPNNIRLNVITHCLCDHVIWEKKKGGDSDKYTLLKSYHETEGECVGHIRIKPISFTPFKLPKDWKPNA